jgi:hypothetical protein
VCCCCRQSCCVWGRRHYSSLCVLGCQWVAVSSACACSSVVKGGCCFNEYMPTPLVRFGCRVVVQVLRIGMPYLWHLEAKSKQDMLNGLYLWGCNMR